MFRLAKTSDAKKNELFAAAKLFPVSSPCVLTLNDGPLGNLPNGTVHDRSVTEIGHGALVFAAARECFQRWEQFDLGWVQVANGIPTVTPGEFVAVESRTAGFWR